ncbi:MAG: PEP-CTERM sorting domain-containing protein [Nitrospirae bacterium]|nr:PEP-CTERM sorting domain-containing protein [Nitrospirota bacterium]
MFKHFGKIIFVLLFGFLLLSLPNTGSATISLEFDPMNQSVYEGNTASVGVWVMNPDTLVSGFDISVKFDSSIISLNSIDWGTSLGILDADNSGYDVYDSYLINIWKDWDGITSFTQDTNGFSLFTMNFDTVGIGTSDLLFTDLFEYDANEPALYGDLVRNFFLSDTTFEYIPITNNIETGSITVASATTVPEPGTALLLGLGLAGLASLKKKKG